MERYVHLGSRLRNMSITCISEINNTFALCDADGDLVHPNLELKPET